MKSLLAFFGVAAFFILAVDSASAATNLFGYPASGVLSLASSPYVVMSDVAVSNGNTLTIEPGVVVKMQTNRAIILLNGSITIGSASDSNQVIITSYYDDTYGGDTNGDGSATAPAVGDWKYIQASSENSQLTINNTLIRYGGFNSSMVQIVSGARATISNTTIEYSNDTGLGIRNGDTSLTLINSIIRNNVDGLTISWQADATVTGTTFFGNRVGLAIDSDADVSHLTISGNTFSGNTRVYGSVPFAGLDYDDSDSTLTVTNNNWGSSSGPTHSSNPSGTGDKITGDGTVTFSPWTGQNQAPTLSYVGTSGYTADGVEPNVSFKTQTLPVFKVSYSDPEGVSPVSINLIIASSTASTYALSTSTGTTYQFSAATSTFAKASYTYHFEASDGTNTARLPVSGELSFEVKNTPVLLVPGIMGTEMWKGSDLIWPNVNEMLTDMDDDFMNVLAMNTDGTFTDNQVSLGDIVRSAPTKDIFASLITELASAGYQENTDLFVLPYDWRLDNRTTSAGLKTKIDTIISQTGGSKVDVVAHSMGGLTSKQYVLDNGSSAINKLVFIGTPHLGAPKAAKTLLLGDDLGVRLLFTSLSADRVMYISQNMTAIYQLLPSQLYVAQNGPYYFDLTSNDTSFTYSELNDYFVGQGLNSNLIQTVSLFHSTALDDFNTNNIDTYNISGCTTPTISSITKRQGWLRTEYSVEMTAGDGTVPIESSNAITVGSSKAFYFNDIQHAEMPSSDGIRQLIKQIVTGSIITLPSNATQNSSLCKIEGKMVSVHSPVNLNIYDSSGNHVGRGENGVIDYNISGVGYEEIGENKFVFLPTSGGQTYQITLDGTGSGTYSLRVSKVENNQITATAYYSDLPVNTNTEATVTLASSVSNTVLQVDQNGTGSFAPVSVSAVLDSTQAGDITAPTSIISVSGNNTATDRYQTSATISLSATDDNAGVLKTEYSLNSGTTWNTYSSSFIITTLGSNTIQYRSTDRAGNVESTKSKTIEIVSAPGAVIILPAPTSSQSQVLGEQVERPISERYTTEEILDALSQAKTETLLDYLNQVPNPELEQKVLQDYGKYLTLDKPAVNFITYGTKSTQKLGIGERAGVIRSYQYAFISLPQTADDWQDVVNIATNKTPKRRSAEREKEAQKIVIKVYGQIDNQAVLQIAYGLRPAVRDIKREQQELGRFGRIFGKMPNSVFDWNVFRELVY